MNRTGNAAEPRISAMLQRASLPVLDGRLDAVLQRRRQRAFGAATERVDAQASDSRETAYPVLVVTEQVKIHGPLGDDSGEGIVRAPNAVAQIGDIELIRLDLHH